MHLHHDEPALPFATKRVSILLYTSAHLLQAIRPTKDVQDMMGPKMEHDGGDLKDMHGKIRTMVPATEVAMAREAGEAMTSLGPNVCVDKKPKHADADAEDNYFDNVQCVKDNVVQTLEQVRLHTNTVV
eukprot:9415027-Pyramimonas_sp.AAC.1